MQLRVLLSIMMIFSFAQVAMSDDASWVYTGGNFSWPGDYSFGSYANYWDQTGGPMNGAYDVKVTVYAQWGGWQPFAPNVNFNAAGYNSLTVALKPTQANQRWQVYVTIPGYAPNTPLDITNYGPTPTVGVWGTYTIPLSDLGTSGPIGSFTIQDISGASNNVWYADNVGFTTQTSVAAPAPVTGAASVSNPTVYYDGQFNWPGSFSYGVTLNYSDTSGAPPSGTYDLRVDLTGQWGAWQPYALNYNYNSTGFTHLNFALKPTRAGQLWQLYFMKVGDIPTGKVLNISNYGSTPVAGQWGYYSIPLSDAGVLGTSVYKFAIQDETAAYSNTWYIDNVGFQ